jgi:hypothetical protein
MNTRDRVFVAGKLVLVSLLAGCGAPAAGAVVENESLRDSLEFLRESVTLQENPDVINVQPAVSIDSGGGFVVADMVESQVRLYGRHGQLVDQFGRKGSGPEEFSGLTAALRLLSDEIAVFDMEGRIAIFNRNGELTATQKTPLVPVYAAALLDERYVAIAGRLNGQSETPLVHVWDLQQRRIVNSFLDVPSHPARFDPAYSYAGSTDIAVRGDTIAVLFALTDSVFLFRRDGASLGSVRIPAQGFRPLSAPLPRDQSVTVQQRWLNSFSSFSDLYWLSDGSFLVQYFDLDKVEPKWRLLHMTRNGQRSFERGSSKLLAVSERDSLFFVHPQSMTPNRWSVATIRP